MGGWSGARHQENEYWAAGFVEMESTYLWLTEDIRPNDLAEDGDNDHQSCGIFSDPRLKAGISAG